MSSTPAKVPASAAAYTPATQDPDLRSQINMLLIREGYVAKIQEQLLHSLNAHPSNWPSAVQSHALTLLRSGDVTTFPALVRRVLEDVRHETAAANANAVSSSNSSSDNSNTNGTSGEVNGSANGNSNGTAKNGTADAANGNASLAIPQAVVEAVLKVTRECLESVCEVDDGGATAG